MFYQNTCRAAFLARPNRFLAQVRLDGAETVCHVKNTGRCRELLLPGAPVILEKAANPARRTAYDLVAVYKGDTLVNIDSQAPNRLAAEYLPTLFPGAGIRPECVFGDSRLDFRVELPAGAAYVEVKGVTLEEDGLALFPDAPTARGTRHLRALMRAKGAGYGAAVLFVIQMEGCREFAPNGRTDPEFVRTLRQARDAGVDVLTVACRVTESSMTPLSPVPVRL